MTDLDDASANLVDAELVNDPLEAGAQFVVTVAGLLEHAQHGLDRGEQVLAGREFLEGKSRVRSGTEPSGDVHTKAGLHRAVLERSGGSHHADIVEHRLAAIRGTTREVHLELAGEPLAERVAHEVSIDGFGPGCDVKMLVRARAGEVTRHHIAHRVATRLAARQAYCGKLAEEGGDVAQFDEVELHVLASGDMPPPTRELGGDLAEQLQLLGGDGAGGHLHAHHLVGPALALAVDAVVQPHHPEHVLGDLAGEVLADGLLEPFDVTDLLGVEISGLRCGCDGHEYSWGGFGRSGSGGLADFAQRIVQCGTESAGLVGGEMGNEAGAGAAEVLDGEDDTRLRVVVVVADSDGPRERCCVLEPGGEFIRTEWLIVDRAAHGQTTAPVGTMCGLVKSKAATAPMTMVHGASSSAVPSNPSVVRVVCCSGLVPQRIAATGVDG
ncbi:unannotated protein [freshwater metagenome]|uniref:Unannotated protein n=1 Tax=freshwater metagenome TaxID=449393 RepID=A0A6J7E708_9ZZZZ